MPFSPLAPSEAVEPGEVAKAMNEPVGASICARPAAETRKLRANGLLRQASRMTMLSGFFAESILARTRFTSSEPNSISSSCSISAFTGTR